MTILLVLHNWLRWLILIGIILIIFKIIYDYFKIQKLEKNQVSNSNLETSISYLKKFFLIFTIMVDIQFTIGILLYFFNSSIMESLENISSIMKQKELRTIIIEHPIIMILFLVLIHLTNIKVKKLQNKDQYKTIIVLLFICIGLLVTGIPWFRPLIRF